MSREGKWSYEWVSDFMWLYVSGLWTSQVLLRFIFLLCSLGEDDSNGLELDIPLLPGQLNSDTSLHFRLWLTVFLWLEAFFKDGLTWYITKWFPFSSSCRSIRRFFSSIYYGNLVLFLEVNLKIFLGSPYNWVTWEFLAFRLVHTEPPAVPQLHVRLPYPATDPEMVSALQLVSALVNQDCLYSACLSSPFWGHWFALCPPFSFWIPKSYSWFFSFLLVFRRECLLYISSWAELEVVLLCKHEAHRAYSFFKDLRFLVLILQYASSRNLNDFLHLMLQIFVEIPPRWGLLWSSIFKINSHSLLCQLKAKILSCFILFWITGAT